MPRVGLRARWAMPVLAFLETRSKIAVPVVSEPVPAVVGTATSGSRGLVTGRPLPRGALTKSRKSASGKTVYRFISLAVSMTEPPPGDVLVGFSAGKSGIRTNSKEGVRVIRLRERNSLLHPTVKH